MLRNLSELPRAENNIARHEWVPLASFSSYDLSRWARFSQTNRNKAVSCVRKAGENLSHTVDLNIAVIEARLLLEDSDGELITVVIDEDTLGDLAEAESEDAIADKQEKPFGVNTKVADAII